MNFNFAAGAVVGICDLPAPLQTFATGDRPSAMGSKFVFTSDCSLAIAFLSASSLLEQGMKHERWLHGSEAGRQWQHVIRHLSDSFQPDVRSADDIPVLFSLGFNKGREGDG
jgi:hypothetical protein